MPHLDCRIHPRKLTAHFAAYDLTTGQRLEHVIAVNTMEGWCDVYDDTTKAITRITGSFEVRRVRDNKPWSEVM